MEKKGKKNNNSNKHLPFQYNNNATNNYGNTVQDNPGALLERVSEPQAFQRISTTVSPILICPHIKKKNSSS